MTPAVANRRYYAAPKPSATSRRMPYAVRYPWASWGAPTYAHRSLADGAGEPAYYSEPTPTRAARRRQFIGPKTAKFLHLMWKHTHTWNFVGGDTADWVVDVPDPWWTGNHAAHPINTGALNAGGESWLSPQPMSDTAKYARMTQASLGANSWWTIPGSTQRIPYIEIFSGPPAVAAEMAWSSADKEPEIFDVRKKCERVLIYKDVYHTNGTISFTPSSPDFILRSACSEAAAVDVDPRWEPFGWGDVSIPAIDFSHGYETATDWSGPSVPSHDSAIVDSQDAEFNTNDIGQLSAAMVSSGFKYSTGHADNGFFDWQYIPNGREFDLIIIARFYKYKHYKYDADAEGSGFDKMVLFDSGFAGIYGECHVLF